MLSAATSGTRFMASRSMTMKGVGLSSSTVSSTSSSSSVLLSSSQRHQFSSMFRSIQKNSTTLTATATTTAMKKQAAVARERLSSLLSSSSASSKITKRNFFSRPDPEVLRSGLGPLKRNWKGIVGTLAVGTGILHSVYGNVDNFYDKRWILECDPDDLADFYGSENFMASIFLLLLLLYYCFIEEKIWLTHKIHILIALLLMPPSLCYFLSILVS